MPSITRIVKSTDVSATDAVNVPRYPTRGAFAFTVGGLCTVPGSKVSFRIISIGPGDEELPQGSITVNLTADAAPNWGTYCMATSDGAEPVYHCIGRELILYVDKISWGTTLAGVTAEWVLNLDFQCSNKETS